MSTKKEGIIAFISDKGYGFITSESLSKNTYFHASSVKNSIFSDLKPGSKVSFVLDKNMRGDYCADVELI